MKTPLSIHKLLAALLTIAALFAGQQAFATSTFTVEATTVSTGCKFTITRAGNTSIAETVHYRTVSLSALAGKHFTERYGTVTFNANQTTTTITISETAIDDVDANYRYQDGTSRKYRFEVLDNDGYMLAYEDRTITYSTAYKIYASDFDEKTLTISSSETTAGDGGYGNNPYLTMASSRYYNNAAPKDYLSASDMELHMTLDFQAKEVEDGYQYIQFLFDPTNNGYDDRPSNASNGDPGTPSLSHYMASFEHQSGSTNTSYASYSLPVTSVGNNAGATAPWNTSPWYNSIGKLTIQKFNTNCRATDGKLLIPTEFTDLVLRFNASGSGGDDWTIKSVVAKIQAVDANRPTVLDNYKFSNGRHQKGNMVYVSVPFSEIVYMTGTTRKLTTSWGDLTYIEGNGTNVLTFQGEISSSASGTFNVTGYSGVIKDMADLQFNGSISCNFGINLNSDYVWSPSDFNSLGGNTYEIATTTDLRHLALMVNGAYNDCSGLTFRQTADIAFSTTGLGDTDENFIAIGGYFNGGDKSFSGTYDGQNHTISNIRLYKNPTNSGNVNKNQALFGRATGATIKNVTLVEAKITGYRIVGGIVGNCKSSTVENCLVLNSAITCADTYVGTVIARNESGNTFTANYYRNCTVNGTTNATNVGLGNGSTSNDVNGARSVHPLAIQNENVTATGENVTYQNTTYYASNTTITLSYNNSTGYQVTYSLNGTALSGNTFTMPANDNATVNAAATLITYTIAYNLDGGSVATVNPTTYTIETPTFTLNNPTKTGCTFAGWTGTDLTQLTQTVTITQGSMGDRSYTAHWTDLWGITGGADGSEALPYLITNTAGLDLLATKVKNGSDFSGKFFKLGNDITYTHTSDWNNATSIENNYTAIGGWRSGTTYNQFKGSFDGDGYTISGIRIYKGETGGANGYTGLFGYVGTGGTVKNVTLADARITGHLSVGGIAGLSYGTVQNCTVADNVCVASKNNDSNYHGGIVGKNYGPVSGCTSVVTLTATYTSPIYYGAVVGLNDNGSSIENCLAVGATIPALNNRYGFITGFNTDGTLTANYYRNCTVGTTANAVNVGVGNNSGAPTDREGAKSVHALTLAEGITATGSETVVISGTTYYAAGSTITLTYNGTPAAGMGFGDFTVTDANNNPVTVTGNTFTMPASDATAEATFITEWDWLNRQFAAASTNSEAPTIIVLTEDYTAQATDSYLTIPSGRYVTLDLNGHTLDRNLSEAVTDGYVMLVKGTLTINDSSASDAGTITGGNSTTTDGIAGGVYVKGTSASFTMTGGTITGNTSKYGGGVYVAEGGTFTLSGGTVSGNTATQNGGGVYSIGTFTMNSGTISDNTAKQGGGVYSNGTFTMDGGAISGNANSGNNMAQNGGGVYVTAGTFNVSGSAVITGNTKGADGSANNVYLRTGRVITVTGALTENANIGVTMQSPGVFTSGLSGNGNLSNFTSDDNAYGVYLNGNGEAALGLLYSVTIADGIEHGTVTADQSSAVAGATVTLTVTPDAGCTLTSLTVTDANSNPVTVENGVFTMPSSNVTVTATFAMTWASLQAAINEGGAITLPHDVTAGASDTYLTVPSDVTVTLDLNGHTLDRNLSEAVTDGYVIQVNGTLILNDSSNPSTGVITGGNNSSSNGGGVYVDSGAFTMNGGTITGNSAKYDGGVCVVNGGTFTLNGGTITQNTVTDSSSSGGSGVSVYDGCTFTMEGGTITNNVGSFGVYLNGKSTFTLSGGTISNHTFSGVRVDNGTFTMTGGTITGNTTVYNGGGVYVIFGTFTMSGGTISGNTCGTGNNSGGGGVYFNNTSTSNFRISGSAVITGNTKGADGPANNVYLKSGKVITVANELTENANIGITMETPGVFTSGLSGNGTAANFTSDESAYTVGLDADGEAFLDEVYSITVTESTGGTVTAPETAVAGTPVTLTLRPAAGCELVLLTVTDANGDPVEVVDGVFTMPNSNVTVTATFAMTWASLQAALNEGGAITLPHDVTAGSTDTYLTVSSGTEVTLNLNGHTLTGVGGQEVIRIDGGQLTLQDSVGGGAITHAQGATGYGVTIYGKNNTSTFIMEGGAISGNVEMGNCAGVYVYDMNATFTMNGGAITGNSSRSGGGVTVYRGSFTMNGGTISNNTASYQGGGICVLSGRFTMNGGTISGNTANYGGGVYMGGDTFNVSGSAVITGNTKGADGPANNVYLYNNRIITVTDALTVDALIGVNMGTPGVFTSGLSGHGTAANFLSDDPAYGVFLNGNGEAVLDVAFTKDIVGYGNSVGGYYLIASPVGTVNPTNVSNMLSNSYDLYRFNQGAALEWENWKQTGNHQHFNLEPGRGYLYANSANKTLYFAGTPYSDNGEVTLAKDSNTDLPGWNLVGNPFADTAYLQGNVAFYVMNDGGSEIVTANRNYVEPMEGIFVVADTDGETLTFSTTAPSKGRGQTHEPEQIVINLSTLNAQLSTSIIDRAIVRFDDGPQLPKYQLDPSHTKVYIQQDGKDYAVVSVGGRDAARHVSTEIPVYFKAKENGTYTLSVDLENVAFGYLHLVDTITGAEVDLLATPSYTFAAKTTDYASRFKLVFERKQ